MPLKPGNSKETVSQNISEFHTGPTYSHTAAKFGKRKANAQAIAVALNTARKYAKKAEGGSVGPRFADFRRSEDIEDRRKERHRPSGKIGPFGTYGEPENVFEIGHGTMTALNPEDLIQVGKTPLGTAAGVDDLDQAIAAQTARKYAEGGGVGDDYNTKLNDAEEAQYQAWKARLAPRDSGADYDLRGAYRAGLSPDAASGHWPDTFKKPNHPTFSDQSQYAPSNPDLAGHWIGDQFVPPPIKARGGKVDLDRTLREKRYAEGGAAFGTGSPAEEMDKPNPLADYLRKIATNAASLPQRAIEAAGRYQPGSGEIPNETIATGLEAAMLPMGTGAVAGVPVRAGEAVLGAGPIRAYHGSPHDFDKFDLSKIGTGEGAQAYGHGLYFADREATARSYRDALSPVAGETLGWRTHEFSSQARQAINASSGDIDAAIEAAVRGAERGDRGARFYGPVAEELKQIKAIGRQASPGRMYEVNINADPAHFLDWDKPLSGQQSMIDMLSQSRSPKIREILKDDSLMAPTRELYGRDLGPSTGEDLYKRISLAADGRVVSPAATPMIAKTGIPGIKYLDQGSRVSGEGSRNYVVFNDQLIDILRKYGIAIPGAAGAAGASIQGSGAEKMKRGGVVLDRALRVAKKYASGGVLDETGLGEVENHVPHIAGALRSDIPGRTDKLPISVKAGSYVVPSDTISALGEGNTDAGSKIMGHMLHQHRMRMAGPPATPGSIRVPGRLRVPGPKKIRMRSAKTIPMTADGGSQSDPDQNKMIPIIAAGGEYVIHPKDVRNIGGGDLTKGHNELDKFVLKTRRELRQKLGKLAPPKVD